MELFGQLIMNDEAEFELHTEDDIINISRLLDGVYYAKEQAYIKVVKNGKLLFEEDGGIAKKMDDDGILSSFVCGVNLDLLLFNNTDEVLDITIRKRRKNGNNER